MADELRAEISHYINQLNHYWIELCKGELTEEQLQSLFHIVHPFKGIALAGKEKQLIQVLHDLEASILSQQTGQLKAKLEHALSLGGSLLDQKQELVAKSLSAFVTEFVHAIQAQLNKEVELEIESMLEIKPEMGSHIKECLVPVLMNAVYHGASEKDGKLHFSMRQEQGCLCIEVFNSTKDVIKNSQTEVNFYAGRGKGLKGAKKKATELDGHLSVSSLGQRGTLVKLTLPLNKQLAQAS